MDFTYYGDITKISPSGASAATAAQDKLTVTGVAASQSMVDTDLKDLSELKQAFVKVGQSLSIHPALLAAIASRESRGGRLLTTDGFGDGGRAYGIMQCDLVTSGINCRQHAWNSEDHIRQVTKEILIQMINGVRQKHPGWTAEQQLQGGIAAYNFGVNNVQTVAGTDKGTTNNDYSNDVIARAQRLINFHGW